MTGAGQEEGNEDKKLLEIRFKCLDTSCEIQGFCGKYKKPERFVPTLDPIDEGDEHKDDKELEKE